MGFLGLTPEFTGLGQANIPRYTRAAHRRLSAGHRSPWRLRKRLGGRLGVGYREPPIQARLRWLARWRLCQQRSEPSIVLYNNVAYVCGEDQIVMVNVTTPTAPTIIGAFGNTVLKGYGDRCVIDAAASPPFLVDIVGSPSGTEESFAVYSLSNPQSPSLLSVTGITGRNHYRRSDDRYGHIVDLLSRFSR